jgi:hypothetical protein
VERALVDRAVTVEADGDAGLLAHALRQREARARAHAFRDDAAAEEADILVIQVHVATAAAGQTGLLAEQLGRHPLEVHATRDRGVMRAMVAAHRIVIAEMHAHADRRGFLPEGLVHFPGQRALAHVEDRLLAFPVRLEDRLVELAAPEHPLVHPESLFRGGLHARSGAPFLRAS